MTASCSADPQDRPFQARRTPTDFSEDVTAVRVVVEPGAVQKVVTLDGVTHQDAEPEAYSLEITAVQDWDSTRPGLAYYLWLHKGEKVAFELQRPSRRHGHRKHDQAALHGDRPVRPAVLRRRGEHLRREHGDACRSTGRRSSTSRPDMAGATLPAGPGRGGEGVPARHQADGRRPEGPDGRQQGRRAAGPRGEPSARPRVSGDARTVHPPDRLAVGCQRPGRQGRACPTRARSISAGDGATSSRSRSCTTPSTSAGRRCRHLQRAGRGAGQEARPGDARVKEHDGQRDVPDRGHDPRRDVGGREGVGREHSTS